MNRLEDPLTASVTDDRPYPEGPQSFSPVHFRVRRSVLVTRPSVSFTWLSITRAEWVWLGAMTLFVLGLTLIPPTVERLFGPVDRVHLGTYWWSGDFTQYLAAMRDGASSPSWLIEDHFSAESHEPILMYPLYVALGKIATASGLPIMTLYAACELLMRLMLPIALYLFM